MASGKGTTPDEYATDSEVEGAISALTNADGFRLGRVATFFARVLVELGLGMGSDDLLQEAIARTVSGRRRWRKTVTFVKHLIETMRSVASHAPDELAGLAVVPTTAEDQSGCLDSVPLHSRLPDAERIAAAVEQLDQIERRFADDDAVSLVLHDLGQGMTGPEIQADLNLSETQYETIMTRLRRGVDRKEGWRP